MRTCVDKHGYHRRVATSTRQKSSKSLRTSAPTSAAFAWAAASASSRWRCPISTTSRPHGASHSCALATSGAYDNILWHRVVPYFVAQGGDPSGTGSGSPGYTIRDELNRTLYLRGTIGMAHAGPETGSSQWFFGHSPQPHLDALHTTFGRVTAGLDVMDALVQQDYLISVRVR